MYVIDIETSEIRNTILDKIVSPTNNHLDTDYQDYLTWANNGNTPSPCPISIKRVAQKEVWEFIKQEHDKRKEAGVYVDGHWFHTDLGSRMQQSELDKKSYLIPPGLMWKTLSPLGGLFDPVYVEMTPALAANICFTTMMHDANFHAAKELHRTNMLACEDPHTYDYRSNWPLSFLDVVNI